MYIYNREYIEIHKRWIFINSGDKYLKAETKKRKYLNWVWYAILDVVNYFDKSTYETASRPYWQAQM
jgi:hypothetical protein